MPGRRGARPAARRAGRRTARRTTARRRRRRRRRIVVGGAVLIGGGALVYKLSKKDAQQIEEYTGVPPEALEDEDLKQAMTDLNLQSQPLTEEDQAALGQADAAEAAAAEPAAAPAAQDDYIEQLKQLAELKDAGILTEEEFQAKKKQILDLQ